MNQPDFDKLNSKNIVAFISEIFERRGSEEYLGEPVTIAQHMLQGALFAEQAGEREPIIVAALLHDIGHFTSEFGSFTMDDDEDRFHEEAGAKVLEPFFPAIVTDCVRHHVAAKRYLCASRPDYAKRLSEASVVSLKLQGGPMSGDEMSEFEKQTNLKDIIKIHHYDDAGKRVDLETKPFSYYAPMVQRVVDGHCGT